MAIKLTRKAKKKLGKGKYTYYPIKKEYRCECTVCRRLRNEKPLPTIRY